MEIVKKNLVSIICGAVAILAVVAVWPIDGRFTALQETVNGRAGIYRQLKDLLDRPRNLPVISLDPGATPEKLEQFPTEPVIARGEEIRQRMKAEADQMYAKAVALNKADKKLLDSQALGTPRTPTNQVRAKFRQEYLKEMDYASPDPKRRAESMPGRIMKAGMKPTDKEIQDEIARRTRLIRQAELPADPKARINEQQVNEKIREQTANVPNEMRDDASKACAIYIEPDTFHRAPGMDLSGPGVVGRPAGGVPQPPEIFWAQLSLWLQEDICKAIAEANSGSKSVPESAIKRLVKIDMPDDFSNPATPTPPASGGGGDQEGFVPPPAPTDSSQPLEKNYAISPTGRYSNPLYDVWNFRLALIVEPEKIPLVLQSLSKNRFITVHDASIGTVDSGEEQAKGFFYGPKPVVQLDVRCEALFLREWTKPLMPLWVKNKLGIVDQPSPAQ